MRVFTTFTIAIAAAFAVSNSAAEQSSAFQGAWEHCDTYRGTQYCSAYVLLQNGRNVCGTWEYAASSSSYAGQLQGTALTETAMQKDRVCGSRGSETQTECSEEGRPQDAWESAHGSLYLVGGGLDESAKARKPYFLRRPFRPGEQAELQAKPWVASCLARQGQ